MGHFLYGLLFFCINTTYSKTVYIQLLEIACHLDGGSSTPLIMVCIKCGTLPQLELYDRLHDVD